MLTMLPHTRRYIPIPTALVALATVVLHTTTATWTPASNTTHLFIDIDGLDSVTNLQLMQHRPVKSEGPPVIVATEPWEGVIFGYNSVVQVSESEVRIYYDTFGPGGRWVCVAVSHDGGTTFTKPTVGAIAFNGSTANNIVAGPNIEPGTVFYDTNPDCLPSERYKMVLTWNKGATMFSSPDGFKFVNMTASPLLTGSDTQDVVFWDADQGGYVYYGRSHLHGGQNVSCSTYLGVPGTQEPGRSINRFVIGKNVTDWPYHSADADQDTLAILNTDTLDPPCIDLYTSAAVKVEDGYFFFPMMYNHFDTVYSQGRGNDGLLEARMVVSRNGYNLSYIDRAAWLIRGEGLPRVNHTGIYEGAFDAASTAVVRGVVQHDTETIMYGYGSQYTHGGYVEFTTPPCRSNPSAPCPVQSGLQRLVLRKNGFVSLSASATNAAQPGSFTTKPYTMPTCSGGTLVLQLNIYTAIGVGARIELIDPTSGSVQAQSARIQGGGVQYNVSWMVPGATTKEWINGGCAFEAPGPNVSACAEGESHMACTTLHDCEVWDGRDWGTTGTCHGVHTKCLDGICQTGTPGGEACGHWSTGRIWDNIGTNMHALNLTGTTLALRLTMEAGDLYSMQTLCHA